MFVDTATYLATDLAVQGDAAGRGVIGTFHAHQFGGEWDCHIERNTCTTHGFGYFRRMKIHSEAGATGAAAFADRQV